MGKDVAQAQGDEKQALLARTKEISAEVKTLQVDRRRGADRARRPAAHHRQRRRARGAGGRRGRLRRPRDGRHGPRLRRRGLRAARPPRAGRGPRRHRHGARRQGGRRPVLLPHGRRRAARDGAAHPGDEQGDRGGLRADDHPHAGQERRHGGRRLPRPPRRRGLPARGRRPLPHRHLRGGAGRLPRRRGPRPVDGADPLRRAVDLLPPRGRAPTARTPAASSGCTSSTRSRCSSTAARRTPRPSTSGCSTSRRRCSPRSSCPTASSTPRPATSVARPRASTTARRGCRPRAATASSPRRRTARPSRPAGSTPGSGASSGNEVAATLNGTLATTRWIVAILENHQQADGSVVVPGGAAPVRRPRRAHPRPLTEGGSAARGRRPPPARA